MVWLGAGLGWRWVRNPWFRYLHLAAVVFVAGEALIGMACPLTLWEDILRSLYYQAPEWVFTIAYAAWAAATLLTLVLVPPRRKAA